MSVFDVLDYMEHVSNIPKTSSLDWTAVEIQYSPARHRLAILWIKEHIIDYRESVFWVKLPDSRTLYKFRDRHAALKFRLSN
jgi:hypothetical protein